MKKLSFSRGLCEGLSRAESVEESFKPNTFHCTAIDISYCLTPTPSVTVIAFASFSDCLGLFMLPQIEKRNPRQVRNSESYLTWTGETVDTFPVCSTRGFGARGIYHISPRDRSITSRYLFFSWWDFPMPTKYLFSRSWITFHVAMNCKYLIPHGLQGVQHVLLSVANCCKRKNREKKYTMAFS